VACSRAFRVTFGSSSGVAVGSRSGADCRGKRPRLKLVRRVSAESVARPSEHSGFFLVLDNCRTLIDAAAKLAGNDRAHVSTNPILATSREILENRGRVVYAFPRWMCPRQYDEPGNMLDPSAVQLFSQTRRCTRISRRMEKTSPHLRSGYPNWPPSARNARTSAHPAWAQQPGPQRARM